MAGVECPLEGEPTREITIQNIKHPHGNIPTCPVSYDDIIREVVETLIEKYLPHEDPEKFNLFVTHVEDGKIEQLNKNLSVEDYKDVLHSHKLLELRTEAPLSQEDLGLCFK